ncbi:MAG: biotin/lipoyl-containing protein, partial [Steroidobacteraceae bacterium]
MTTEIKVPKLPESVADATLVNWHKKPGDAVARDENLADLETDKVVLEVPAPVAGILKEIKVQAGATVISDQLLAIIEAGAVATAAPKAAAAPTTKEAAPAAAAAKPAAAAPSAPTAASKSGPAARRVAAESGVDMAAVAGSGLGGAVTKADVLAAPVPSSGRVERRVPMTRLRARIAERLITAQSTQALLTTFNEVDLLAVQELRSRYKDKFEKNHGVKL